MWKINSLSPDGCSIRALMTFDLCIGCCVVAAVRRRQLHRRLAHRALSSPRPPAVPRVRRRVLQLSLELLVCSVHPPPGAFYFHWRPVYEHPPQDHPDLDLDFLDPDLNPDTDIDFVFYLALDLNLEPDPDPDLDLEDDDEDHPPGASRLVPIDALLALPMFFRLYLVCR